MTLKLNVFPAAPGCIVETAGVDALVEFEEGVVILGVVVGDAFVGLGDSDAEGVVGLAGVVGVGVKEEGEGVKLEPEELLVVTAELVDDGLGELGDPVGGGMMLKVKAAPHSASEVPSGQQPASVQKYPFEQ
jgi:hypothetical protein